MAQEDGTGPLPRLQDSLYAATVPELKWYAAGLGIAATRKDDLVVKLSAALTDRVTLERLWAGLSADQRLVIADVVHAGGGRYTAEAIAAKYPGVDAPRSSRVYYYDYTERNRKATPFDVFFLYQGDEGFYIPPEVAAVLRTVTAPPPPTAVQSQADPPTIKRKRRHSRYYDQEPSDEVLLTETEGAAFHDLAATLALVGEGKATVSATTQMPTLPTLRNLRGRLLLGDYFADDYGRAEDAIRPLALVLLVQAAKWAAPGGASGTKLALTPAGQALLAGGIEARHVREAWQRWLKSDLLDELARIRNIKGQQSREVRLSKPATRRPKLAAALAACPTGQWVLFADFLRYMLAEQLMPTIENNRDSGLYVGYRYEWGGESFEGPYWDVITGSYLRALVWEYAATLGLVEIAYTRPENSPHDLGEFYSMDEDYLSRYDGLLGLRLTNLGAFVLGQAATYRPPTATAPAGGPLLTILPNLDVVLTDMRRALPNFRAVLARMATVESDLVYHLNRDVLLDSLDQGFTLDQAQAFLTAQSGAKSDAWPQTVQRFFSDIAERLSALREAGAMQIIEGDDPLLLAELANTTGLRTLVQLAQVGDHAVLLVPTDQAAAVRRQLKRLGYLPRRTPS